MSTTRRPQTWLDRRALGRTVGSDPEQLEKVLRFHAWHSVAETSKEFRVSERQVKRLVARQTHARGQRSWLLDPTLVARIKRMWQSGMTKRTIAREIGVTKKTMTKVLKGIAPDSYYGKTSGPRHWAWKGGRTKQSDGYVVVMIPRSHPFYEAMRFKTGPAYVLEHRLVMAEYLGRPLSSHETVHHVSGDRTDNRIENLQLRSGRHGKGVVLQCLDCGSHNVVAIPIPKVMSEGV